jgi:hypothetical protein
MRDLLKGWLDTLLDGLKDKVLAIDGKCLRGTQNNATINSGLHLACVAICC